MSGRFGPAVRPLAAVALVAAATAAVGLRPTGVSAAQPAFMKIPTRLYMIPAEHSTVIPDVLAGLAIPIETMKFDDIPLGGDVISRQSRVIEVVADEAATCRHEGTDGTGATPDPADDFDLTGCTALQIDVAHGTLKFDPDPSEIDDPRFVDPQFKMYRFASGALLRDADDPSDFEQAGLALIGTAAQINQTIKTLVYTPEVDDPATENVDEDYYYDGSNPETLSVDLIAGDPDGGASTLTENIDIRVLDYNNFPEVTVPDDEWATDNTGTDLELFTPNANPSLEPDVPTVEVADEDNDEVIDLPQDGDDAGTEPGDGDDPDDGAGDEFLVIAWTTCGKFSLISSNGFDIGDDLVHVFDYVYDQFSDPLASDPADRALLEEALLAALPDDVEQLPFANTDPSSPTTALVAVADDIEDLNYNLGRITFHPVDAANQPLQDTTCKLRVLISDLGNNGLPIQYIGDPPSGLEIPMFGVDFDTNYVPTVEELTITIGGGGVVTPAITSVSNVTLAEGDAGTTPFTFTLTLDAPATGTESVDVFTSYTGGVDLTDVGDLAAIPNQTVTFAAGASSATFTVPVNGDTTVEPNENFELNLTNPVGLTIGDDTGLGTVVNDDPTAGVQITSFDDEAVVEGNPPTLTTPITFTIGLSAPAPAGGVSVRVTTNHVTTDGTDLTPLLAQQVSFLEGQQTRTVTVNVDRDITVEPSETFTATLSNPVGASIAAAAQSATGTITNDDFRTVSIGDVSMLEGNAGTTAFTFTLTLDDPAVGGEAVQVAVGGGTATSDVDYVQPGLVPVTFVPGATTETVTVDVMGDPDFEPDDTFFATLIGPSNLVIGDGTGQGTILNDDPAPDVTAPTVTINQGAGQLDPTAMSPIIFDVVFSEPVTGFATGDVTLGGTAGATTADVTPLTATTYTVSVSGMTQDGTVIASIAAGVAQDAATNGNAASTSTDNQVTYDFDEGDVTDPTVTINQGAGQLDPTAVSPIIFDVVFSEAVTGFAAGDVTLGGTAGATTAVVTPLTASTYTVAVSGMTQDGTVTATIPAGAATDAAMNLSEASTSTDNEVTFQFDEGDQTPPTVTINQGAAQADPTSVSPIVFDVVFSEPVTGFTNTDVQLSGTAVPTTAVVNGSGTTYTVSVSGMSVQGTVMASIPAGAAMDAATNVSQASTSVDNTVTFLLDQTAPTVTINQGAAQSDPTTVSPIIFDVVFSEPVTGFTNADVTLSGTAMPTTAVVTPITAATYTVAVSGMTQDGTVIATIPAGAATDAAMNPSLVSTSIDNQVTFDFDEGDVTDPTVTINQGAGQSDPTSVSPIVFDVVFSEPVAGFAAADVALSGTAMPTTAVVNGSGATYTVSVSGMSQDGTVIASIPAGAATDAANNPSLASTSIDNVVTFDFTDVQPPSPLTITVPADITVPNDPGQPGAVVTYAAPTTSGGVAPVTVTCSSPSGGFYPIGITTVTCTATDSAQGQQQLALAIVSDSFTITVVDTTPPPDSTAPPVTPPATPPTTGVTAPDVGQLPATGGDTNTPLVVAFGTCLVGLALLAVRRRSRPAG